MTEPSLPDKVVAVHRSLENAKLAHAFGGALALAYYAEPRATIDIDINVFVPPAKVASVLEALTPLGVSDELDAGAVERDGQGRTWWGRTPLDLFFAYDDVHEAMRRAIRRVPFGDETLPVLSPEHLVVCKAVFSRPKDWLDIEQVLVTVDDLDVDEVDGWVRRIVGDDDPRRARLAELVAG